MSSSYAETTSSATESSRALIEMSGIVKRFGAAVVLEGVDLTIRAGEVHALMGENGAGKSTLLKILAGDLRPDGGSIAYSGVATELRTVQDARDAGIAIVHQELSVIENLSVVENLFLGRELRRGGALDRRGMSAQAEGLLARLGLRIQPETPVSQLEVAERQAIEICAALAQDAQVLVLDEPTAALTETERLRLFTIIEQLRAEGLAIVYVSHHLSEIERLADRVTVLRNGHVVLHERMGTLTESDIVLAMLGEPVEQLFPPRADADAIGDEVLRMEEVSYGRRLHDTNVTVRRGEVIGVTGLLGSGHRELGRVAAGLARPTGGRIHRTGSTVRFSPGDRKGEGLALERSGIENLTLHDLRQASYSVGFRFLSRVREWELASRWAARLAVAGDIQGEISLLSGGNQQKILLGRNMDGRADLLVLEEPTRGVDVGARQDLYRLIRSEAERGAGVMVVSTDLREVAGFCDRVLVLNHGRLVARLTENEITEEAVYEASHSDDALSAIGGTRSGAPVEEIRTGGGNASALSSALRRVVSDRSFVPWLALIALMAITALGSSRFLTAGNFENLARQSVTDGLVGLGQMMVVLTGNIDLSIGSIAGLANLVSTEMLMAGIPAPIVFPVVLAIGLALGLVNALLVRLGMPSLLATFAMASVLEGVIVWRYPVSIGPVPASYQVIDSSSVFGIPSAFLAMLVLFGVSGWVLRHTRFGLHLYAVGGDARAARLSGAHPHRVVTAAFAASGLFSALAGLHLSARLGSGLPNSGDNLQLDALAVVVIGGVAILGGAGNARGVLAGVGIVAVLANLMNLTGLDAFVQDPIKGAVIVLVTAVWGVRQMSVQRRAALGLDLGRRVSTATGSLKIEKG